MAGRVGLAVGQVVAHRSSSSAASSSACASFLASFRSFVGVAVGELVDGHVGRIGRDLGLGVDRPVWQLSGARRQDEIRPLNTVIGGDEPELGAPVGPVAHRFRAGSGTMFGYGVVAVVVMANLSFRYRDHEARSRPARGL